jgi:hypothetical protein
MTQNACGSMCGNQQKCHEIKSEMSCFSKIAGTLTGEEIKKHKIILSSNGEEIQDNKSDNFKATTVDLTVGDGHYLFDGSSNDNEQKWQLLYIGDDDRLAELNDFNPNAEQYKRPINSARSLIIPPFCSALVQLDEVIDTYSIAQQPENMLVVGRFDLKLSKVHQGLISQQATQVEPCYRGKLFCFIHNLSGKSIEMEHKDALATIEFSYVSCFCNKEKRIDIIQTLVKKNKEEKYTDIYCRNENGELGKGIFDIRYFYHKGILPEDCGFASFNKSFHKNQAEIKERTKKEIETFVGESKTVQDIADSVWKRLNLNLTIISQWAAIAIILLGSVVNFVVNTISKNNEFTNMERSVSGHQELIRKHENRICRLERELDKITKTTNLINDEPVTKTNCQGSQ